MAAQKKAQPRWKRIAKRVLLVLVALVVGLPLLAVAVVHSDWAQSRIRQRIEERAGERLTGKLAISKLHVSLFSDTTLAIDGVVITDAQGREAVAVDHLDVGLDWWKAATSKGLEIDVAAANLKGVRLLVVRDEDGTSNLSRLVKPKPKKEPKPKTPPKDRHIVVRSLAISEVGVTVQRPDGTEIAVKDAGLDAKLDLRPLRKDFAVEIPSLRAGVTLDKPNLTLGVTGFETGLKVALTEGAGQLAVAPTKATIGLELKGAPKREFPLNLDAVTVDVAPGELGLELERLLAGALALQALNVEGRVDDGGSPSGDQRLEMLGLKVDAKKLNELLDKEILESDVELKLELSGPPEKVKLDGDLDAEGLKLTLDGLVNATAADGAEGKVTVVLEGVDTTKLLATPKVPPVFVQRLQLDAEGKLAEDRTAKVTLDVDNLVVRGRTIDEIRLEANLKKRLVEVEDLRVGAYGQGVIAKGTYHLDEKSVDLLLTAEADLGDLLRRLKASGVKVKTPLPPKAIALREGVLQLRVKGQADGELVAELDVDGLPLGGGRVYADVDAKILRLPKGSEKPVELQELDGHIRIREVYLDPILAWRGKKLENATAAVSADVKIHGAPNEPSLDGRVTLRAQTFDARRLDPKKPMLTLETRILGVPQRAKLSAKLTGTENAEDDTPTELLKLEGSLPLDPERRKLALYSPWSVDVDIPKTEFEELLPFLPGKVAFFMAFDGEVGGKVKLRGSPARPQAEVDVDLRADALENRRQRVKLSTRVTTRPNGKLDAATKLKVFLDEKKGPLLDAKVGAELSRSPLIPGGPLGVGWNVDVAVPDRDLATIPVVELKGRADVRLRARGSLKSVHELSLDASVDDFVREDKPPIDAKVHVAMDRTKTDLDLAASLVDVPMVTAKGKVERGGEGLIVQLRRKDAPLMERLGDPAVSLDLRLTDPPIAALAPLSPKTANLPGNLHGGIDVRGKLSAPTADGRIFWDGFKTVSGKDALYAVDIDGGLKDIILTVAVGPDADLTAEVKVPRADIKPYLDAKKRCAKKEGIGGLLSKFNQDEPKGCDVRLPITATVRTKPTDLAHLVPALDLGGHPLSAGGSFNWTLDGKLKLDPAPGVDDDGKPNSPLSEESSLKGVMTLLDGHISIPGTKRRYERIALRSTQNEKKIELRRLELHESDREKKDRSLVASATVTLDRFRPDALTAKLKADDFLVYGDGPAPGARVGSADAPRGALDADIAVTGALNHPVKKLKADIRALELTVPYRYNRSHQPEVVHIGDLVMMKKGLKPEEKKALIGKLPVPPKKKAPPPFDPKAPGLDVDVSFSRHARLQLQQLDLITSGKVRYQKRGEAKRIDGKLTMHGGSVYLGGKFHKLIKGHILFDEDNPGGYMDLLFGRREHNATLRDVSKASAGRVVKIHLEGPLSNRRTTLSGAGSPGTLYDLLSVHNAGRPRYTSHPDLPASMNAQYPQFNNLLMLSFFSVNVPGVLLMDKVGAWADPYDGRGTERYGEVQHYEAEGYAEDGSFRVRVVKNPPAAGQSDAEVTLDVLFTNTAQTAAGVGIATGNRGGGGPGVFFEWSSED